MQALTVDSQIPSPRRTTSGLETSRVSMMLAVLEQRGRINAIGKRTSTRATVGGVKLSEPAADLAVALALASAASDTPLPKNLVADRRGGAGRARCAGSPVCSAGWPRRPGWASRTPWCRRIRGRCRAGMKVTEVADIGEALRVLPRRQ